MALAIITLLSLLLAAKMSIIDRNDFKPWFIAI